MPSDFDTFASEFAAPAMSDHFAERDEHGKLAEVECKLADSTTVELVGVVVGNADTTEPEPTLIAGRVGSLQSDRTCRFSVPKEELDRKKAPPREVKSFKYQDQVWPVLRVLNEYAAIVDFETSQPIEREGARARSQ